MDLSHARRPSALPASASHPLVASSVPLVVLAGPEQAELSVADTSLSFALRLRLSLLGLGIGVGACAICAALGLLIVSVVFATSPGGLA
jgi:hypothetical protein